MTLLSAATMHGRTLEKFPQHGGVAMIILAGTVRRINPGQSKTNCVNCAIATDAMLAGRPASALPGAPQSIGILERIFGAQFSAVPSLATVVQALVVAGSGSRGIVFGSRDDGVGHVFNAVNQHGVVRFLDGQTGTIAVVSGYTGLRFLRTA